MGKARRLHPIPLNDDGETLYNHPHAPLLCLPPGSPVLPIQIGGLKVYNLGKVVTACAVRLDRRQYSEVSFGHHCIHTATVLVCQQVLSSIYI